VVLNLGSEPTAVALPTESPAGRLLVSTFGDRDRELVREIIDIRGNEGVVVKLSKHVVDALPD
jgi:hypothetical protein